MTYKAIFFDWDGTLINSLDTKVKNAGILFRRIYGFPSEQVENIYRKHSGIPRRQLFEAISGDIANKGLREEEFAQLSAQFTSMNRESLGRANLFEGAKETLKELHDTGIVTVVSSSATSGEIVAAVKYHGLDACLNEVLGSEGDFTKGKAHVDYICQKYGIRPAEVIVVGDEPADIVRAKEAGATSVAKAGTYSPEKLWSNRPDYIISAIPELLELIRYGRG